MAPLVVGGACAVWSPRPARPRACRSRRLRARPGHRVRAAPAVAAALRHHRRDPEALGHRPRRRPDLRRDVAARRQGRQRPAGEAADDPDHHARTSTQGVSATDAQPRQRRRRTSPPAATPSPSTTCAAPASPAAASSRPPTTRSTTPRASIEYLGRDAPWADGNVGMYGHSYDAETQISTAGLGDAGARRSTSRRSSRSRRSAASTSTRTWTACRSPARPLLSNGAYLAPTSADARATDADAHADAPRSSTCQPERRSSAPPTRPAT